MYCISLYKQDGITEVYTCLVLDWGNGEFLELYDHWPGFEQVAAAITKRLPGIVSDWLEQMVALGVDDPPLKVWHRA